MTKRTLDRIAALEAAFAPPPDRFAELRRMFFPVPMTLNYLDDREGYIARCRAAYVAAGNTLNDDARPDPQWVEGESEAYIAEQQRRLVAEGQAEIDALNKAQAQVVGDVGKTPPPPQRKSKPPPPFVHVPSVFDTPARA